MSKTAVVLLSSLLCMACATQQKMNEPYFLTSDLFGMVYDENNQPCAGAMILCDGNPGPTTDIRGRFVLSNLARGEHSIAARKEGFEELTVTFAFLNRTDVLYMRMVSFDQLLSMAERALGERKWDDAESYLQRAEKLDAGDTLLLYLMAIRSYKVEKYDDAAGFLEGILSRGGKEPHVYLFLADLYEHYLNNPSRAIANLEAYLEKRVDVEVEKRLTALKKKGEG